VFSSGKRNVVGPRHCRRVNAVLEPGKEDERRSSVLQGVAEATSSPRRR
jgi:hypothetical protein